jgi:hypothetical protein
MRTLTAGIMISILLFVASHASAAKVKSSWKNPSANAQSLQFKKVLVVATIKHELTRKVVEDRVVEILRSGRRVEAVPSYTILSMDDLDKKESSKAKVSDKGFDGVILIHYADSSEESRYDPDAYNKWNTYNDFWSVYAGAYNSMNPRNTKLYVEIMLYSLKEGKLIWSGITEAKNPKNPAVVVGDIAAETTKTLRKQGLIPSK